MKRLTVFLFYLLPIFASSQVETLGNVSAISSFDGNNYSVLFIRDLPKGGQFNKYIGSDLVDDAMVFLDAQNNKWKRFAGADQLNIQWFGASSDKPDNRAEILSALEYIKNHPQEFNTLYIPANPSTSAYYQVSDEIAINFPVKILGDGTVGNPTSKLQFGRHKNGLIFSYPTIAGGFSAEVKNLWVSGTTGTDTRDINKHGIIVRVLIKLENIYVTQVEGNGIHVSACALQPSGDNNNYGNADGSYFENITATFCNNGIY